MKISVSLSVKDVEFLDEYAHRNGRSRSAPVCTTRSLSRTYRRAAGDAHARSLSGGDMCFPESGVTID
jgi:hypothetical protein